MSYLNYEFFDEFKALDNLCRDMYGKSIDNKLGVTRYLEDMDEKSYRGAYCVPNWTFDYKQLKSVRNLRNELAHSQGTFSVEMCTQEDIDFIRSFRERILSQTDPIALLRKQSDRPRRTVDTHTHPTYRPQRSQVRRTDRARAAAIYWAVFAFIMFVVFLISMLHQ